jgi:demethylmenaquinone methyltransferase/2-methoxy-6-polyprenyl-1,4-benzoquinol methylase
LPEQEVSFCIDLACGTGDIAFLLAEKYPQGRIVGVDITALMLECARQRNKYKNVQFINADMGHLDVASGSADIVTGGYALRNAPHLETALEEIHRVLKPGGTAAFLDFSKSDKKMSQKIEYWTLKIWGGLWGVLLHRNPEVYGYIAESLRLFPDRVQLRDTFRQKGFSIVSQRLYFLGITELLVVRKV